jgi:hypothetical protein
MTLVELFEILPLGIVPWGVTMRKAIGSETARSSEPWLKADLFFLDYALRHGMSVGQVAGFLGRSKDEVEAQAHRLNPDRQRTAKHPVASPG